MRFNVFKDFFNPKFEMFLRSLKINEDFLEMLVYTPLAGGKRLRPFIIFSIGKELGIEQRILERVGFAVEIFHSASLIHDDLPSIDDDRLRRGKKTHHVKFGEDNAILTGDYSMLLPVKILNSLPVNSEISKKIVALWIDCSLNVVLGEYLDVKMDKIPNKELLNDIYILKTAALFRFCFAVPFILKNQRYDEPKGIGTDFGISFQLLDDIKDEISSSEVLGKTPGKDKKQNKLTILKFVSLDEAKKSAKEIYFNSLKRLSLLGLKETSQELRSIFDLIKIS
jgi:geranylgeranyl diphosphate synthase type II